MVIQREDRLPAKSVMSCRSFDDFSRAQQASSIRSVRRSFRSRYRRSDNSDPALSSHGHRSVAVSPRRSSICLRKSSRFNKSSTISVPQNGSFRPLSNFLSSQPSFQLKS
jgi:hypothetical protein